jgi:putative nucleotidyltransferase with HDIG domain
MGNIDSATLRRKVENIQALPTIPGVLKQILGVIEDPRTSLQEISRFVSNDPALTLKILKMVNSPVYGFPGRISSVSQGVVLLGLNVVKGLLLGISVFDLMQKAMIGLWEHSLGCAVVARILAKKKGVKEFEEVSVAGLLHDLGKVILILLYPREYEALVSEAESRDILIYEAEKEFFGVTHADVAVWMTEKWSFPKNLVDVIGNHHRPGVSRYAAMETAIVHVSDILIKARGFGFAGDRVVPSVSPVAWKLLDLTEDDLREALNEMEGSMEASAGLFE